MEGSLPHINSFFKGKFLNSPEKLQQKLSHVKAYVFDWDGVFNNGFKNKSGSVFSEVDSMGTNLLRFNHYLCSGAMPYFAVLTGEKNIAAKRLGEREHFDGVGFKAKNKGVALKSLCDRIGIQPSETVFVFDDVLDLSAAAIAGIRLMVPRPATAKLVDFAVSKGWVDYLTANDGDHHAVRECTELLMNLRGQYEETLVHRIENSDTYKQYLEIRQAIKTIQYDFS